MQHLIVHRLIKLHIQNLIGHPLIKLYIQRAALASWKEGYGAKMLSKADISEENYSVCSLVWPRTEEQITGDLLLRPGPD